MPYPIIHNGDHAEFEREHANTKPEDRPDWPLPSFDARDWARHFCNHFGVTQDGSELVADDAYELMLSWFASALMRGYDEHAAKSAPPPPSPHDRGARLAAGATAG